MELKSDIDKKEFDQGYDYGFDRGYDQGFNLGFVQGYEQAVKDNWDINDILNLSSGGQK